MASFDHSCRRQVPFKGQGCFSLFGEVGRGFAAVAYCLRSSLTRNALFLWGVALVGFISKEYHSIYVQSCSATSFLVRKSLITIPRHQIRLRYFILVKPGFSHEKVLNSAENAFPIIIPFPVSFFCLHQRLSKSLSAAERSLLPWKRLFWQIFSRSNWVSAGIETQTRYGVHGAAYKRLSRR